MILACFHNVLNRNFGEIPYPLEYNHGVIFFKMGFWVRFNSKNPSKSGLFDQKMGFYSRKTPKTGLLKRGEVVFKSGALLERIRYVIFYDSKKMTNFFEAFLCHFHTA